MDRQLILRKTTFDPIIDVGLFWLPDQNEFVTWLINKQHEHKSCFGCMNGHYYLAGEFDQAKADFDRRM
jgi:hypothetical protein